MVRSGTGDAAIIKSIICHYEAMLRPELIFYVTRIGCGIAGFSDSEIAPLFQGALEVKNIILPKSFHAIIDRA